MIQVGLLTEAQKDELVGQLYDEDSYFNPIQDLNDNWIISVEEIAKFYIKLTCSHYVQMIEIHKYICIKCYGYSGFVNI